MDNDYNAMQPLARVDNTFTGYFSRFVPIVLLSLIFIALPAIISNIVSSLAGGMYVFDASRLDWYNWSDGGFNYNDILYTLQDIANDYYANGGVIATAISFIASLFLTPVAYGAIAAIMQARFDGVKMGFSQALSAAMKNYGRLITTNLCAIVMLIAVCIVGAIVLLIVTLLFSMLALAAEFLGFLMIILAAIVFIFALLGFAYAYYMAFTVVMTEEKANFAAVGRAISLMFTGFWRNFGTLLLAGIAVGIFSGVMTWFAGFIGGMLGSVLGTIASNIANPLVICGFTMCCFAARSARGETL